MKKFNLRHLIFLLLLFVMIAFFTALIFYFPNKSMDFSGTVTKISTEEEVTVLEISNENGASYVV